MVALNPSLAVESHTSLLQDLTSQQQSRLTELLDEYLTSLENGERPDADRIKNTNPDLATIFQAYLEKLDALYGGAAGFHLSAVTASGTLEADTTLGDFTIHREIGRGGMGIVYEASQQSLDRRVAIKLLPLASLLDTRQIARFKNEAHAAGLLKHSNIVPIYSIASDRGMYYYAMQFIDGESIDAWIALRSKESAPESRIKTDTLQIIRWGIDIARALHHAHENGVVHRDVKPSNLMLDSTGKIWIADFGLARCQSDVSLTQPGDVIGTVRYMSPEQAGGHAALIDGRSDIYSLAATLYEMLTLRPALDGDDAATLLRNLDQQDIKPLRRLRPDLPRDLETVIAKAMAKRREDRYETAEAFADDLNRVLNREPTIARPPTITDRFARFAARHHSVMLTGAMIVGLTLIGLAVYNTRLAAAKRVSDANATRAARGESLARDAVDRLGSQMAELLSDIPAAESIRRQLLTETLDYYKRFASELGNDPSLRKDLAVTLGKIGLLQRELGNTQGAIASLSRSETMHRELAGNDKNDDQIQLAWSTSQNNLAQALIRAGQIEEAARYFSRAITTQHKIADHSPVHSTRQSAKLALATSLNNLGLLLAKSEAFEEAETRFIEAIELLSEINLDQVESSDPNAPPETQFSQAEIKRAAEQLAAVRTNLSGLLIATMPDRAVHYARDALSGRLEALENDRSNTKLASQIIATLNTLGSAQTANDQTSMAIQTLHRAIEIGEELSFRWPDQPNYVRDLALSYNHLGLALTKSESLRQAHDAFERAVQLSRPLASRFDDDAETQSMLGGILNNQGYLLHQLNDQHSSAAAYREAVEHQSVAVRLAPKVVRYQVYLKKHRDNLNSLSGQNRDISPAEYRSDPSHGEWRRTL